MRRYCERLRQCKVSSRNMSSSSSSSVTVSVPTDPRPHPENYRAHHPVPGDRKRQFSNPWASSGTILGPTTFMKARLYGELASKPPPPDILARVDWRNLDFTYDTGSQDKLKASWLGHASMFLEFPHNAAVATGGDEPTRGIRVLLDPIFSDRCSPTQYFGGPRRYTPAATSVDALPEIDVVCLSHNHYDHLDYGTIKALLAKFPQITYFVPIGGVRQWFIQCGVKADKVHEMDWWDELHYEKDIYGESQSLRIGYLPAQHFTGRGIHDQGQTLWGSFSIEAGEKKVWFAGDTGRRTISKELDDALHSTSRSIKSGAERDLAKLETCPAHRQIGSLRGPFDLAIIPIGAYAPRYLMSRVHVDPSEAIEIFKEVHAKRAVGVHWGTYQLSTEDVLEPRSELSRLSADANLEGFDCWGMGHVMYI